MVGSITLGTVAAICGISAALSGGIVGMVFRAAAAAWKTERDAAVDKAERLDKTVADQADQIRALEAKVAALEKRTDYEAFADRSGREHTQQLAALTELSKNVHANTVAVEFLVKQVFPQAGVPFTRPNDEGGTT